jgi:hypothetical protein
MSIPTVHMPLDFVARISKRLIRAKQRHPKDILVKGRIKAPIAA